ncbi:hypothetical protein POSPLADRAFT_1066448 [Postia placenta MAD-698-R-SB12]|uniref:HMG box domain-containing protein n=1 Tax=Postia placenta MAD-698-R-SB12 TaxID=670580 RepID=A0A1X6MXP8_9APHY|nr:hypothetical protein POSPLADRAFT_1066448 [Postia placenta MAD-698-R-SB12]OSX61107.1 hypothetical protein POSPLADRAFT_1066448 [Postia placenta MAD-698-R-SB12]
MAPARNSRARQSSLDQGAYPGLPSRWGTSQAGSARPVVFAPNVTPTTYAEADSPSAEDAPSSSDPFDLPPEGEEEFAPKPRRRVPANKRPSLGYIPRPANAFMLFRSDFVRRKHLPGSIETNHGTLSKILGTYWKNLPPTQRDFWEKQAKKVKAAHEQKYPGYKYQPKHDKEKRQAKAAVKNSKKESPEDEERVEQVAQFLLAGKTGDDLAQAIRKLDLDIARRKTRSPEVAAPAPVASSSHFVDPFALPFYAQRRSSSVPLHAMGAMFFHQQQYQPQPIALPLAPPMSPWAQVPPDTRSPSPVGTIARSQRSYLGQRRVSSAQPVPSRPWYPREPSYATVDQTSMFSYYEPLPEADMSLFEPAFVNGDGAFSFQQCAPQETYNYAPCEQPPHLSLDIGPLADISPLTGARKYFSAQSSAPSPASAFGYDNALPPTSGPSSAFTGSPSGSDYALPAGHIQGVYAPQPVHLQLPEWAQEGVLVEQACDAPTPDQQLYVVQDPAYRSPPRHFTEQQLLGPADSYVSPEQRYVSPEQQYITPEQPFVQDGGALNLHLDAYGAADVVDSYVQYEQQGIFAEAYAGDAAYSYPAEAAF